MKSKLFFAVYLLFISLYIPSTSYGLTVEEEKKYGKEIFLQIANSVPINNDPYISLYLQDIKNRLEGVTSLPFPITLTVIQSQTVNAFATIGGYIYLTTGLIGFSDTEEELAGVLAHELAHITRRHIAKRLEKEKYINIGMLVTMLAGILVGGDPKASEAIIIGGQAAAQALSLKYSRDDEDDADRTGATFSDRAGYNAVGVAEFLKKLRVSGRETTIPQYLLTHPYHEERIIKIENAWHESKTTINTSFYPFLVVRANVLHRPPGAGTKEIWLNRYQKEKDSPTNAYGASLVYMSIGNISESVRVASHIKSPYKNLFMGEAYVNGRQFAEAVEALKNQQDPISKMFLAKAYEGHGNIEMAAKTYKDLLPYGPAYPEIFYRLGMLTGRMGLEGMGHEYLGRYYIEIGKYDLAKNNLEKAINKYGINSREAQELLKILDQFKKANY
jgi:predicted Zn-dependent protease